MGYTTKVFSFYGAEIVDPPGNIYEISEPLGTPAENGFGVDILEGDMNTVTWFVYMCLNTHLDGSGPTERVGLWDTLGMGEHEPSSWWYEQADAMSELAEEHGLTVGDFDLYVTVLQR